MMRFFIEALKSKLRNNKTIAKNTGYLTIIECVRIFMPFVALPYIIRTVGMERYGMVALAQTIVQYFIVVINFGLDISAVKDVSVHRNDKLALNRIVSTVLFIKLILFFALFFCVTSRNVSRSVYGAEQNSYAFCVSNLFVRAVVSRVVLSRDRKDEIYHHCPIQFHPVLYMFRIYFHSWRK